LIIDLPKWDPKKGNCEKVLSEGIAKGFVDVKLRPQEEYRSEEESQ